MTKKTRNLVVVALVLCCGALLLIWAAMDAQWIQTVSAQEVIDNPLVYKSKSLQVYGRIVPDSVKEQRQIVEFELYWPKDGKSSSGVLHVKYTGLSKVNLAADRDVLIDCRLDEQGGVTANRILTKCPSKYKSRQTEYKK